MRLLTINVTRKNGKYIGTLEECPEITCESDCIDDIIHAMKIRIIQIDISEKPEALKGSPLKFRITGEEDVFSNLAIERDTKSRTALNEQLGRISENLERISPLSLEEVAMYFFCHYRPTLTEELFANKEEMMASAFELAEKFLTHKKNRYQYYWKRQFGLE